MIGFAPWIPLALAAAAPPSSPHGAREVFAERGAFATVYVVDEGPLRYLRFDSPRGDDQSVIDTRDPTRVPMAYVRVVAGALALDDDEGRALVIGVGGGAFPMLVRRTKPAYVIDAVDVDPLVLDVARRYFGVKSDDKLSLIAADGARFVSAGSEASAGASPYSLVLLDAYGADGIPEPLATVAFFRAVRARVAEGGAVVINIAVDDTGAEARRVARAFHDAFPVCLRFVGRSDANVILVGFLALTGADAAGVEAAMRRFDASHRPALPFRLADEIVDVDACAP